MAGFKSSSHHANIARAVKGIVAATIGHLDEFLLHALAVQLGWVDKVGGTKLARPLFLFVVDVDGNDHASLVLDGALDDRQTDTARAKHGQVGPFFDLGGHHGGAVARRDTAAEQAGLVGSGLFGHGDHRDVRHNGVLGKSRGAHKVQQVLAARLEARCPVGHDAFALGGADLAAQVGLAGDTELALFAFGGAVEDAG